MLDQLLAVHVEHGQLVLSADKDDVDTQLSFDGLDEALFAGDQEAVLLCCGSLIPDLKYFVVSDNHVVLGIDRLQAGDCSVRLGNFIIGLSEYLDLVQVLIVVQFALRLENLSKFHWILDDIQELFTNFVQNRQVQWLLLCARQVKIRPVWQGHNERLAMIIFIYRTYLFSFSFFWSVRVNKYDRNLIIPSIKKSFAWWWGGA